MNFPDVLLRLLAEDTIAPLFRIQHCVYPDGCVSMDHQNEFHHTILSLEGCAIFKEQDHSELRCEPGTLLTIPPHVNYKWHMEGRTSLFQSLHNPFNFIEHRALANLFGPVQRHLAAIRLPEGEFAELKRRIEIDMDALEGSRGLLLSSDVLRAMAFAAALSMSSDSPDAGHPALAKAMVFLEGNLSRELSLDELACHSGLTSSRLSHLFRQHTGTSPMQYFAMLKASRATTLMLADGLRVCEVAERLGFASESYFRRFYKRQTGNTPGSLKKSVNGY